MSKLLDATAPGAIEQVARLLKLGRLVAYPTDTLYGVGASIHDPNALESLYRAKNRPRDKGIPVLLADQSDLSLVVDQVPAKARELIDLYWPGPLTLIMPKRPDLPESMSPNEGIAVRIPDSSIARELIRCAGGAIATSSANQSGAPPARTARQALEALGGAVDAILDGGQTPLGVASTIIDFTTQPPSLLRSGPISIQNLDVKELRVI
jgi:L-threonylcarbamoyladenylate synthase